MANDKATESDNSGKKAGADGDTNTDESTSSDDVKNTDAKNDSGKTFTQDDLDAIVQKRLAKEKKKWEGDKDLTEMERLKKENEELRQETVRSRAAEAFETAAAKQGVKNTRGLYKAVAGDLEFDATGKVSNLEAVLKTAKTELPEFFAGGKDLGNADGGKGGDDKGKSGGSMNDVIRAGFGRTS